MIKNKLFILIVFFLGLFVRSYSQEPTLEKYVIISFESKHKISYHGTIRYYWIIPLDSIKTNANILSRLFIGKISRSNYVDCCNGKSIDPALVFQDTIYTFDSGYNSILNKLTQTIIKNRKKLQKIIKQWESGQKEEITIYATPVLGKFCSSNFHAIGQQRYGYRGKIFIPYSTELFLVENFWESSQGKYLLNEDFSKLNFSIIPY